MTADPHAETPLPERVDVAVVGGGIIGTSAAWHLAKSGTSVLLAEKGRIAGEQSSRNWGFVRQQGRAVQEMPLIIESLRAWRRLDEEIGEETGFRQSGVIYVADTAEKMAGFERWIEIARQHQLDSRLLTTAELTELLPDLAGTPAGAMTTPSDGRAEPALAAPAIARAAERAGAAVVTRCAVRGLDLQAGRVAGIVTEKGRVACDAVLLAGGAWSSLFTRRHGVPLPQLKVQNNVFRTTPCKAVTEGALWSGDVAVRRRLDDGFTVAHGKLSEFPLVPDLVPLFRRFLPAWRAERSGIRLKLDGRFLAELFMARHWPLDTPSPFEGCRVLDPVPTRTVIDETLAALKRQFPVLGDVRVAESWAGMIDVTPDAIPVISGVDALPGLHLATGFSGHGFGIGPGAGRLAAELVTGRPPCVDPAPFRHSRFYDGSTLQMGPGV